MEPPVRGLVLDPAAVYSLTTVYIFISPWRGDSHDSNALFYYSGGAKVHAQIIFKTFSKIVADSAAKNSDAHSSLFTLKAKKAA